MRILKSLLFAAFLVAGAANGQEYMPGVRVEMAPPPLRIEQRPYQPSPNHIWIDGHWAWRYGRHEWMRGHWALPPGMGYRWQPARWVNEGGHWVFFEGHWLPPVNPVYVEEPAGPEVYATQAPPPEIVENRPMQPGPNYVWAPGYWRWQEGRHVWVGGYWTPRRDGYRWASNHWENRGGRWVFVHGGWIR